MPRWPDTQKVYDARLELKLERDLKARSQELAEQLAVSTNELWRTAMREKLEREQVR